jgi:hypothetical protein
MAKIKGTVTEDDEPVAAVTEPVVDEDDIVRGNVNRIVEKAPSFVSVYANDVQLQTTPWDVRLTFGAMRVDPLPDGKPLATVTEVAEVRLSPQLAKRVMFILFQQIKAYETRFGPIPQPRDD